MSLTNELKEVVESHLRLAPVRAPKTYHKIKLHPIDKAMDQLNFE